MLEFKNYKFTIEYSDNSKQTFFKYCKHYKKTKVYKNMLEMLDTRSDVISITTENEKQIKLTK